MRKKLILMLLAVTLLTAKETFRKGGNGAGKLALVFEVGGLTATTAPNGSEIRNEAGNQTVGLYVDLSAYKHLWDTAPSDPTTPPQKQPL